MKLLLGTIVPGLLLAACASQPVTRAEIKLRHETTVVRPGGPTETLPAGATVVVTDAPVLLEAPGRMGVVLLPFSPDKKGMEIELKPVIATASAAPAPPRPPLAPQPVAMPPQEAPEPKAETQARAEAPTAPAAPATPAAPPAEICDSRISKALSEMAGGMLEAQVALRDSRPSQAISQADELLKKYPGATYLHLLRASAYTVMGRHNDALAALGVVLKTFPLDQAALRLQGKLEELKRVPASVEDDDDGEE